MYIFIHPFDLICPMTPFVSTWNRYLNSLFFKFGQRKQSLLSSYHFQIGLTGEMPDYIDFIFRYYRLHFNLLTPEFSVTRRGTSAVMISYISYYMLSIFPTITLHLLYMFLYALSILFLIMSLFVFIQLGSNVSLVKYCAFSIS